ncbi:protein LTV1 homolog [Spodoptera frugiperda]|uniref:Protein LTV1 homolog n=1 Tax=Spodoptera frugiperda TaxID=7108 RepID=A0A9R0DS61_SPOFR|nr:protein LTV1 homolog [Spodoptera frugiperda]
MPKTKKKFIDRKKAVTFNLVHRSQRDPLAADETAPQRVLVPVSANIPQKKEKDPELTPEQRREEQIKYGIYFDDDYNYLQHLKDSREVTLVVQPRPVHKRKEKTAESNEDEVPVPVTEALTLPSSVFASEVEEDVGLLNKAAPQGLCLDLDPEVVAALDDDFDFDDPDNQLEDNFIDLAMAEGSGDEEYDDDEEGDSMSQDDDSDKAFASDLDSDDDSDEDGRPARGGRMRNWEARDNDDTKSRFSQYSMSSSVMRRNQGLTLLDNRFEKMFAEYDDTEVGALDLEEIEGFMPETHDMLLQAAEHFEESQRKYQLDKEKEIARINRLQEIEEESEEELVTVEVDPKEKWDCETILSTYSNLYNHPKVIEEPKKPQKIKLNARGIPKDVLGKDNKLTVKSLAKFNAMQEAGSSDEDDDEKTNAETVLSTLSVLSIRPKDETPEEKKERKRLLKEYRKERRVEKKANKEAFKEEKKRQEKIMMNNKNNVQGNRIL